MKLKIQRPFTVLAAALTVALLCSPALVSAQACYQASDTEGVFNPATTDKAADVETHNLYAGQLNKSNRTIARCYAKAAQRDPDPDTNKKTILFGIRSGPDGKVNRVSVLKSDLNDGMLLACLAETICGFTLTADKKFSAPFDFRMSTGRPDKLDDFRDGRKL